MTRRWTIALTILAGCAANTDEGVADNQAEVSSSAMLPNWATPEEEAIESAAAPPAVRARSAPPVGYRIPAEYEPVSTVVMTWTGATNVLRGISVATAEAGADVWMVGGPSSIQGVATSRYKALNFGYDSIWSRDYGPVGIDATSNTLGIVDTTYRHYAVRKNDDAVSCRLAGAFNAACHTTNLILDGGNYMSDGKGNAFLTRRVYDWNKSMSKDQVDKLLRDYLGATTIHILDYASNSSGQPADGTGHLDMFAKLVAPCKVLVVETSDEPFRSVTEKAARYFENLSCEGGRYQVSRVKGWVKNGTWYTYSNSLMVNKSVIIPFYNDTARNTEAQKVYQDALPGYTIVGVNSEQTIVQGGSIHCITKEIPALTQ